MNFNNFGNISISGHLHKKPGDKIDESFTENEMRILGEFALVYVYEGKGFYKDENGYYTDISAGDCIFIDPKLAHIYGPKKKQKDHWKEFFIVFNGEVFDLWKKHNILNTKKPVIHLEPIDLWLKELESIWENYQSSNPTNSDNNTLIPIIELQNTIASMLYNNPSHKSNREDAEWLTRASEILIKSDNSMSNDLIGQQLNMSYENFRKKFKRLRAISPKKYKNEYILKQSINLLSNRGLTIKEIADQLGFCDEFHFSKSFYNFTGRRPSDYRKIIY